MKAGFAGMAMVSLGLAGCATSPVAQAPSEPVAEAPKSRLDERIAHYAQTYEVPESLVRRSIVRESGYNPKARNGPYWGLMQIRYDTAKNLGYRGPARGLLDADTNLKYACAYLANAYKVAEGDANRAISLYARGYYYEARRKGLLDRLTTAEAAESAKATEAVATTDVAKTVEAVATTDAAKPAGAARTADATTP